MEEKFKEALKKKGQNMKWFYDNFIKYNSDISLTYSGFAAQLNGYAPLSNAVEILIRNYTEA